MAWRDLFRVSWWRAIEERWSGTAEQRAFNWNSSALSRIPGPAEGYGGSFAAPDLRPAASALQSIAIWAAVGLKADLVSTLPLHVYRGEGAGQQQLPTPLLLEDPGGEGYGLEDWLTQWVFSDQLRGNVYGTVASRDTRTALPTQIVLYHPDEVRGWRDPLSGLPQWTVGGRPLVDPAQMWHRRARTMPGELLGLNPIALHATAIGQGLSASRYGSQWFTEGAHPSGILSNDNADLTPEQAKVAKHRYLTATRGSREPLVLDQHWSWTPIGVTAEESQFLATQRYTDAQCARIFGPGLPEILGYETGGSLTYSTIEQRSQDLLTYTLDPLLVRLERMFTRMLPGTDYAKFQRAALLRTDLMTRFNAYRAAIGAKFMTPDEVRALEERPPLTPEQKTELAAITVAPAPAADPKGETP